MSWVAEQLESSLIDKGVSEQHVKEMKNTSTWNKHEPTMFGYYDPCDKQEIIFTTVPLDKIKITSRVGTHLDETWLDLAKNAGKKESYLDYGKIKSGLKRLINATDLTSHHRSFQHNIHEVDLIYWKDDDMYSVANDGNHRTIMAKLTNAPYIKAKVTTYVINQTKYTNHQKIIKIIQSFEDSINKLGFYPDIQVGKDCLHYNDYAQIHYYYSDALFQYYFEFHRKTNSLDFEQKFLQLFSEKLTNIEQQIIKIHRLKNMYRKMHTSKYLHLSSQTLYKLHRIRCFFQNNKKDLLDFSFCLFCIDQSIDLPPKKLNKFIVLR